jgi:Na+/proline symporter
VLPTGIRAIIISAILAAAMSSLDSSLNSLSAATLRDFVERRWDDLDSDTLMTLGKVVTVAWGIFIVGFAFLVSKMESKTVIEAINKVGSAFYGPVLATFVLGVLSKRANTRGVVAGVLLGVGFNLALWLTDAPVHWMWWNVFGFLITVSICWIVSRTGPVPDEETIEKYTLSWSNLADREKDWLPTYGVLLVFFGVILAVLASTSYLAG